MSSSLLDVLKSLVTPDLARSLAGQVGASEGAVSKALGIAFPSILSGLLSKSQDHGALNEIVELVSDRALDPGILKSPTALLGALQPNSPVMNLGSRFLSAIFGSRLSSVAGVLGNASGTSSASASSLLGMAAPLVMAVLGDRVRSGGLGAAGLASLLAGQRESISKAVPAALSGLLGLAGGAAAAPAAAWAEPAGGSKLLWPAIGLLALLGVVWAAFRGAPNAPAPPPAHVDAAHEAGEAAKRAAEQAAAKAREAAEQAAAKAREASEQAAAKAREAANQAAQAAGQAAQAGADAAKAAGDWAANLGAFLKRSLPGGVELNVPERGIESQLVSFIEDTGKPVDTTTWFNFDRLLFETGSAALNPKSMEQIQNMAAILKAFPAVKVKLGGYTDNTGNPQSNLKLSDDRANTVMAELVKLGIASDRLAAEGYGEQHPIGDNATEAGRAQNRRIALRVTAK